jgi:hypothetical protein
MGLSPEVVEKFEFILNEAAQRKRAQRHRKNFLVEVLSITQTD